MTEKYNGWSIITDRGDLEDLIVIRIPYGIFKTMLQAFIEKRPETNKYYVTIYFSSAFFVKKSYPLRSKDYYSLVDEANDIIRGMLTKINEDIISIISELPDT